MTLSYETSILQNEPIFLPIYWELIRLRGYVLNIDKYIRYVEHWWNDWNWFYSIKMCVSFVKKNLKWGIFSDSLGMSKLFIIHLCFLKSKYLYVCYVNGTINYRPVWCYFNQLETMHFLIHRFRKHSSLSTYYLHCTIFQPMRQTLHDEWTHDFSTSIWQIFSGYIPNSYTHHIRVEFETSEIVQFNFEKN